MPEAWFERTMEWEGGFSDHPADTGGPTAFGVTCWAWARHNKIEAPPAPKGPKDLGREDIQEFFAKMRPIMAKLTKAEAMEFLWREYVVKPGIDKLHPEIAPQVADMSVNMGPRRAIRLLQEVLVESGLPVDVDGRLGPQTRGATDLVVETVGAGLLNDAIAIKRAEFYRSLGQREFMHGWLRRAAAFAASHRAKETIRAAA